MNWGEERTKMAEVGDSTNGRRGQGRKLTYRCTPDVGREPVIVDAYVLECKRVELSRIAVPWTSFTHGRYIPTPMVFVHTCGRA